MVMFTDWLLEELKARGISQSQFARLTHLSPATISLYLSGQRSPTPETLEAIARALGLPTEAIYRAAGLLPDAHTPRSAFEEIIHYRISQLTDKQLDEVMQYLSFIMQRDGNAPTRTQS